MNILTKIAINLCRLCVGLTFILSGFVKAVDPIGTQYKIQDYAEALSLDGLLPDWAPLSASVILSCTEIVLGI